MKASEFQKVLFKGAFLAMACDGEVHTNEILAIKQLTENSIYFDGIDYDTELRLAIEDIKKNSIQSIHNYCADLKSFNLLDKQKYKLIEILIKVIEADEKLENNELQFIQLVKSSLDITDEIFLIKFPKYAKYLMDLSFNKESIVLNSTFQQVNLTNLEGY